MHQTVHADHFCDAGEAGCGDLVMVLHRAIKPLQPGQVLEVRAVDPAAVVDIPAWCFLTGHELLTNPTHVTNHTYFIRKKGP